MDKHTDLYRRWLRSKEMYEDQQRIAAERHRIAAKRAETKRYQEQSWLRWFFCEFDGGSIPFNPCCWVLVVLFFLLPVMGLYSYAIYKGLTAT